MGVATLAAARQELGQARAPESISALRWIGAFSIPTGTQFDGVAFGGISGLDRAPDGRHWAVSDDRGGARGSPRFYALNIDLDGRGFNGVSIEKMVFLRGPDGQVLPANTPTVDPEAIRLAPNGHLYVSSEGHWSDRPGRHFQPFVHEYLPNGRMVRALATPKAFNLVDNTSTGGRSNKLFEALAVTPGGSVWVANEEALIDDGPVATPAAGSWLRVAKLDVASGKTAKQYAYALPKIPLRHELANGVRHISRADNGLTDLLALSETAFIAVERAYVPGEGVTVRLVRVTIETDTTDISSLPSLPGAQFKPLARELLLELAVGTHGVLIDNIEAIAWGPVLVNGNRSLILVSDNNFSRLQTTQFLAFEVVGD